MTRGQMAGSGNIQEERLKSEYIGRVLWLFSVKENASLPVYASGTKF
jgi:hypothetical protein